MSENPSNKGLQIRLFVAGNSPSSRRARRMLRVMLDEHQLADVDYEIIDVLREPARALEHNLLATPTLIIDNNGEISRYVGDDYEAHDVFDAFSAGA